MSESKFQEDVLRGVLNTLQEQVKEACEPYVQEALQKAERAVRERVAQFAIALSQQSRVDYDGRGLFTIQVDFKGLKP